ncbi:very short patch repair endonuclease [Ruminobacter amylophilus]|uniref:very short patch repair endonuclease n=1 Tax=Ruminobacter amylophilus TaxID=867 RepID=UPI0038645A81
MVKLTTEQRHRNMRSIRSKDTSIERMLRSVLWKKGLRYRKNYDKLPGKPDIVLVRYKIAVFCDSEFFHGKDWEQLRLQLLKGNNAEFWINKISRNRMRDDEVNRILSEMGWTVIRFWGKDIKKDTEGCAETVQKAVFDCKD